MDVITVTGIGRINVKPDFVSVYVDITEQGADYDKTVSMANDKVKKLKGTLTAAGLDETSLKTLDCTVDTVYDDVRRGIEYSRKLVGYKCKFRLVISFDFTAKQLSKTLGAVADSRTGAEFRISFSVKDWVAARDGALLAATEDARRKAETLCRASGRKLGRLISVRQHTDCPDLSSPVCYGSMPRATNFLPDLDPADMKTDEEVEFTWQIDE